MLEKINDILQPNKGPIEQTKLVAPPPPIISQKVSQPSHSQPQPPLQHSSTVAVQQQLVYFKIPNL